jgi:hypothetical protein
VSNVNVHPLGCDCQNPEVVPGTTVPLEMADGTTVPVTNEESR